MSREIKHAEGSIEARLKEAHDLVGEMATNETNITNEWNRLMKENKRLNEKVVQLSAEIVRLNRAMDE